MSKMFRCWLVGWVITCNLFIIKVYATETDQQGAQLLAQQSVNESAQPLLVQPLSVQPLSVQLSSVPSTERSAVSPTIEVVQTQYLHELVQAAKKKS